MNTAELDGLLRESLKDFKLAGRERETLLGWVQANVDTENHRSAARSRLFEAARESSTDETARKVLDWIEDCLKVLQPTAGQPQAAVKSGAFFSPGDECLAQIVHRFGTARRSADVCVFTITDDRLTRALIDCHRRGVKVRVISDDDKAHDLGSDIDTIADSGVEVRVDRTSFHMHHKYAVFDGLCLLNGSYNWTRGAAEQNEENITVTGDAALVKAYSLHFEKLWKSLR